MKRIERGIERRIRHLLLQHYYVLRPSMQFVKEKYHNPIVGCEVGSFRGKNAYNILRNIPNVKTLYLVDPYELYEGYTDFKLQVDNPTFLTEAQQYAHKLLKPYESRIRWVQAKFEAEYIPEPLDFIYIDGQHTYEAVTHDIIEAEKLVKNGVIGGHDYYPENHHLTDKFGVGKAVRDHYGENHYWRFNDWWVTIDSNED